MTVLVDRARRLLADEPVVLLITAAAVIVLGVDLDVLSDTVQRLVDLAVLAGAAYAARARVVPLNPDRDDLPPVRDGDGW